MSCSSIFRDSHHQMEVFLGGSWHLKALPGVSRTPVQQLGSSNVVLTRNTYLPVTIDYKLGATVLEGWAREERIVWC